MKTVLKIEGMSCDHCVRAVKAALESVTGVKSADVNLKGKSAEVEHTDEAGPEAFKAAVEEAGFEVV